MRYRQCRHAKQHLGSKLVLPVEYTNPCARAVPIVADFHQGQTHMELRVSLVEFLDQSTQRLANGSRIYSGVVVKIRDWQHREEIVHVTEIVMIYREFLD